MYIKMLIGAHAGEIQDVAAAEAHKLIAAGKAEREGEPIACTPAAQTAAIAVSPGGQHEVARQARRKRAAKEIP